jgi:hypothetical protein
MLEHTYEVCLEAALRKRGLQVVNVDALAAGGWKRVLRRR